MTKLVSLEIATISTPEENKIIEIFKYLFPLLDFDVYYSTSDSNIDEDLFMIYDETSMTSRCISGYHVVVGVIFPELIKRSQYTDIATYIMTNGMISSEYVTDIYDLYLSVKHL